MFLFFAIKYFSNLGGLLNKTVIEKQVSFLTMNKVEECTFQDNQSKSNIGNTNSMFLQGNNLAINKDSKFNYSLIFSYLFFFFYI